ncbi:MAG TPA: polysaccharide lyase family protein [Candidatus Acidoferrales bacterium]|nr:polysaccharide lyase family protein [Candidatus Acidoferrales bacterium]
MNTPKTKFSCFLAFSLLAAASSLGADSRILWQLGQPDRSGAEFALAPDGWSQFKDDAFFIVGKSDVKRSWPYVHPGVDDAWAGGRPHTFRIFFGVAQPVDTGDCKLEFDLVDTHSQSPPMLNITVNGQTFQRQMPAGAGDDSIQGHPAAGKPYHFDVQFPVTLLTGGNNEVDIANVAGSWLLYDRVALETPAAVTIAPVADEVRLQAVVPAQVLVEKNGKLFQPLDALVLSLGEPGEVSVQFDGTEVTRATLKEGPQHVEVLAPDVSTQTESKLALVAGGANSPKILASLAVNRKPMRKWTVYILMHSHNDIGYTDLQPNIQQKQAHNVLHALELIRQYKDAPLGERFKWNLEVLWPADQFFKIATPDQVREFDQDVHDGYIGVDAMYGNLLTGLCRYEEMLRQVSFATQLGRRCGRPVDSMMISDVPGLTWGIVPVMAGHGVKYISDGPNASRTMAGDRIGYVRVQWENRPFYWQSPAGDQRVLYWGSQGGYSFGHHFASITEGLPFLLQRLDEQKYAYDIVQLRWTKGDNGPPDEGVMPAVRDWNAKYAYPKLIIATTSEAFHAFEKRYGDQLPTFRGDMTPYWEDGAGSSALETGLNRHTADRLVQAETMWALRNPGKFPADAFAVAWKNAALYSEHTWGAYNSVSQPDLPFVKSQWKYKQGYALDADAQSRSLLAQACGGAVPPGAARVDVFNTASWPRTDLVTLPAATQGDAVTDEDGRPVPSQRLSTGDLVFLARAVPAFGAKRFTVASGNPLAGGNATVNGATLTTPELTVMLNEATGDITSLRQAGSNTEFANGQINNYLYLPGADLKDAQPSGPAKISVKEHGPLVVALLAESAAPGCNRLLREVRLVDGLDRVEISDLVDKKAVRAVEGVHLGFSFNIPDPVVRVNIPGTIIQPEKDQLPGACKNWFPVERWVDISDAERGVTWSTAEAPLMELGGLTANLPRSQPDPEVYLKSIKPSSRIYSWVMNNHWHTNYRADQEGPVWFHYAIQPHGAFDPVAVTHFGVETTEPLIVAPAAGAAPMAGQLRIEPPAVVASAFKPSDDGQALILRLYNPSEQARTARLVWSRPARHICLSSAGEEQGPAAPTDISVPGLGTVTLRFDE